MKRTALQLSFVSCYLLCAAILVAWVWSYRSTFGVEHVRVEHVWDEQQFVHRRLTECFFADGGFVIAPRWDAVPFRTLRQRGEDPHQQRDGFRRLHWPALRRYPYLGPYAPTGSIRAFGFQFGTLSGSPYDSNTFLGKWLLVLPCWFLMLLSLTWPTWYFAAPRYRAWKASRATETVSKN